jgi:hydrogenase maturation protease
MPLLDCSLVGEAFAGATGAGRASPVLVLGVGNLLMGDEGVGIHALRALETRPAIPGVRLLDGGTGGANLLGEFDGVRRVILLDATFDQRAAGTITYQRPTGALALPRGLSAHDFGLKDLFVAAELLGRLPELHLYTISIATIRPMCTDLSAVVAAALPRLVTAVHRHAARLTPATCAAESQALRMPRQAMRSPCADILS